MKRCRPCGIEYPDDMNFCSKCGTKLEDVKPAEPKCPSCGADVAPDAAFCSKCGAKLSGGKTCSRCGQELPPDARFCDNCGTPVGAPARPAQTSSMYAPPRPAARSGGSFIDKAVSFERSRHVAANSLVIVLALVFMLVALLCPIKISAGGTGSTISEDGGMPNNTTVSQSIWQVIGAVGYLNLDVNDADDKAKIREIYNEYNNAGKAAATEFQKWYADHTNASESEITDKALALAAKHLGECNILAYELAYTTLGALDMIMGSNVETSMNDLLVTARSEAVLSLVFALIAVFLQIVIAVVSLVFMILAIVAIVGAKPIRLYSFLNAALSIAGAGLAVLSCGPTLAPLGAMLAIALTAALVYFACGLTVAIFTRKKPAYLVKRAVCAAVALTAFFLMCAPVLGASIASGTSSNNQTSSVSLMLGGALDLFITCLCLGTMGSTEITYSTASMAGSVAALALGVVALVLLLCALVRSLKLLARDTESKTRVDAFALTGAIMLLLFAVVPSLIGAVDGLPTASSASGVGMHITLHARAYVYVSLVLTIAAFVFGIVFVPAKFGKQSGGNFQSYFTANAARAPETPAETQNLTPGDDAQNVLADASVTPSDK